MYKITQQAVKAFLNGEVFHKANTIVQPETDGRTFMYLHGNKIACKYPNGSIKVTLAGWPTPTTRERLNGITYYVTPKRIYQRNYTQYYGDREISSTEWFTLS